MFLVEWAGGDADWDMWVGDAPCTGGARWTGARESARFGTAVKCTAQGAALEPEAGGTQYQWPCACAVCATVGQARGVWGSGRARCVGQARGSVLC